MTVMAVAGLTAAQAGQPGAALSALAGAEAAAAAPELVGRALDTFLAVEEAYRDSRYRDALRDLEALWQDSPPGDAKWAAAARATRDLARSPGLNIGQPPCYYALRMLTDCVHWRLESGSRVSAANAPYRAVLAVVLVGRSAGVEPRTAGELETGAGVPVEHLLAPELLARVDLEGLVGSYLHHPVQNDWHTGTVAVAERDAAGRPAVLRWTNAAGVSWRLVPDLAAGILRTGEDCPYYRSNPDGGRAFHLVLRRDVDGEYLAVAAGFAFQGGFYALQTAPAAEAQYEKRDIQGWTVLVNRRLLDERADLGRPALLLLEAKLHDIGRTVPEAGCRELRRVPIWLGVDDGHAPCAEYHPSRDWLRSHGYNPDKAECVEIGNAERFLEWSKHQPMMVLHELAHAYHHRVLGHDHAGLRAAFEAAVAGGTYDAVLAYDGKTKRAYAMNSVQEYFAELSECFFGTNDFYPFVRAELEKHDPAGFQVLRQVWESPPAAARP